MADMAPTVSRQKYAKAEERAEQARKRLMKAKADSMKITQVALRSVGVGAAAGLIGYAEGRAKPTAENPAPTEVFGLPLGLVVAATGTIINVAGYGGDEATSGLIQAAADGGLAAYLYGLGKERGLKDVQQAA